LGAATSPPSQGITGVKVLARQLEILFNLICLHLGKVPVARDKVNLLRRAAGCGTRYYGSGCGNGKWFLILRMETGVELVFGRLEMGMGIKIIATICKEAAI